MRLIDLDEFLRQNCVDRMEGKSCEECKHHVLAVSCERLMEQPTIVPVKRGRWVIDGNPQRGGVEWMHCSECGYTYAVMWENPHHYCPNCGARMDVPDNDVGETGGEEG